MPRHNLKKYTPAQDSTPGLKTDAAERGALCLNTKARAVQVAAGDGTGDQKPTLRGCPCGCEGEPVGRKRTFLMGHDARLRGKLIRAHLTDTPVARFIDGQFHDQHSAVVDAKAFGESFVTALKEAETRRHATNRKVLNDAMNSKRLIKVGRWKYTGQVAAVFHTAKGDEYEIKYVAKTGEVKTVRVPADKAPLASAEAGDR